MEASFGVSRVTPPRLRRVVERKRLLERLEQERDKKLFLVLGQGAQGKSTLAASWARSTAGPCAWVNLGAEESDPVNLFHLLIQSLEYALKDRDLSSLRYYLTISMGPRVPTPLYRDWSREILRHLDSPIDIVFDGLDRLSPDAPSFDFLQVLCEEWPPGFHIMMLSRARPPMEIQRLKANREMEILTNEQLAFSLDETKAFFKEIRGVALRPDQARRVHEITEGWVGGLILLSDLMDRIPEESREAYLSDGFAEHLRIEAFEYFSEQVFSAQPAGVKDLLIKTSILETVEPEFVEAFLGVEQAETMLQELAKTNLFIQSIHDENHGLRYRYHQLFKDFLQARLAPTLKGDRPALLFRAGSVSEQKGDLEGAVKFFLEAEAYPEAARVIEKIGNDLLRAGRTGDLSRWLEALPEELIQESPWLLFYHSMCRRFTANYELGSFERAITLFERAGEVRGILLALAHLIETTVVRGHFSLPLERFLAKGEEMLQSPVANHYPYEKTLLWTQVGFAYIWAGVRMSKGLWASHNAYLMAKEIEDLSLQVNALGNMLAALATIGDFRFNDETRKKLERIIGKCTHPEQQAMYMLQSVVSEICRGNLLNADEILRRLYSDLEKIGLISQYSIALYMSTLLATHFERFAEAEECGNRLLNQASSMGNRSIDGLALLVLGLSFYHRGDFEKAMETILRSIQAASSQQTGLHYFLSAARVTLALVFCQGAGERGARHIESELNRAIESFRDDSNYFSLVDAHLAMALLKWKLGQAEEAAKHLQAGFGIARERDFHHFLYISPKDLARACVLGIELQVEGAADLLTSRLAPLAEQDLERLSGHPDPKVARRAFDTRRIIHRRKVAPLRIETLGNFRVLRGEIPIEGREWEGNQSKRFLMALIARGGRQVPREPLIEDLWPEVEPSLGQQNFSVNLHRLRRVLEPALDKRFGSSYIHLKNNFLSLDDELCRVDLEEYLGFLKEGARRETSGDHKGALSLFARAEELYRGDFLREELYSSWAVEKREELRKEHFSLLSKMAGLYERRGSSSKAIAYFKKIIDMDPTFEEAYQKLMVLYSNRDMRAEAIKTYEKCRTVLQAELGVEPGGKTAALYRQVLAAR